MSREEGLTGPLDVPTLEVLGQRASSHPLVAEWALRPDDRSPRRLEVRLDADQYPSLVAAVRLDVRWYEGGDYSLHYVEDRGEDAWQCRWDRHPKPETPRAHFHPPPSASGEGTSNLGAQHHLGVLFAVLDWIENRVGDLHDG